MIYHSNMNACLSLSLHTTLYLRSCFLFLNYQCDEEGPLTCHQCKRNDKGRVVRCKCCNKRRFCLLCLQAWYNFAFLYFSSFHVMFTILHCQLQICLLFLMVGIKALIDRNSCEINVLK